MPQLMPMNWGLIFLYSIIIMAGLSAFIFFQQTTKPESCLSSKFEQKSSTMSWPW